MSQRFGTNSTYTIGQYSTNKVITPFKEFTSVLSINLKAPFYYPILNDSIFFNGLIFNSYVIGIEEKFSELFSYDGKLTVIVKTDIPRNTLITFVIVKESDCLRTCEVYDFKNERNVGYICKGRVVNTKKENKRKFKDSKTGKRDNNRTSKDKRGMKDILIKNRGCKIRIGSKEHYLIPLREYFDGEEIEVMLVKKENEAKLFYREMNMLEKMNTKSLEERGGENRKERRSFSVCVVKEADKYFLCQGEYLRGIILKGDLNREVRIGELLSVQIARENNFRFLFTVDLENKFTGCARKLPFFYKAGLFSTADKGKTNISREKINKEEGIANKLEQNINKELIANNLDEKRKSKIDEKKELKIDEKRKMKIDINGKINIEFKIHENKKINKKSKTNDDEGINKKNNKITDDKNNENINEKDNDKHNKDINEKFNEKITGRKHNENINNKLNDKINKKQNENINKNINENINANLNENKLDKTDLNKTTILVNQESVENNNPTTIDLSTNILFNSNLKDEPSQTKRINFEAKGDFNLYNGMVAEAIIKNTHSRYGTFVRIGEFVGQMMKSETSKDYVSDIEAYLRNKKVIKGVVYNVDKNRRMFLFSAKKFEEMEVDFEDGLDIEIPFKEDKFNEKLEGSQTRKIQNKSENLETQIIQSEKMNKENNENNENKLDTKQIKIEKLKKINKEIKINVCNTEKEEIKNLHKKDLNENDSLSVKRENKLVENDKIFDQKIKKSKINDNENTENCKLLVKDIKLKIENSQFDACRDLICTNYHRFDIDDLQKICLKYIKGLNSRNINLYSSIKGFSKFLSEDCLEKIIDKFCDQLDSTNKNIFRFYYQNFKSKKSFTKYLSFCLLNKIEDNALFEEESFSDALVDRIYKIVPAEARVRIEKSIDKNTFLWENYIKNEEQNIEYARGLYKRVSAIHWNDYNINREWFKRWLIFEKMNGENVEEVKQKAIEFCKNNLK